MNVPEAIEALRKGDHAILSKERGVEIAAAWGLPEKVVPVVRMDDEPPFTNINAPDGVRKFRSVKERNQYAKMRMSILDFSTGEMIRLLDMMVTGAKQKKDSAGVEIDRFDVTRGAIAGWLHDMQLNKKRADAYAEGVPYADGVDTTDLACRICSALKLDYDGTFMGRGFQLQECVKVLSANYLQNGE